MGLAGSKLAWFFSLKGSATCLIDSSSLPNLPLTMETVSVCCNHCGAPLEVTESTRFVTCQFCKAKLAVKHTSSTVFTEVIEQLAETTARMAGNLEVIEIQNDIEKLDREWEQDEQNYMVKTKHGQQRPGSPAGQIVGAVVGVGFLIFWISSASSMGAPTPFVLFGVVMLVIVIGSTVSSVGKFNAREAAHDGYQKRRRELEARLHQARGRQE